MLAYGTGEALQNRVAGPAEGLEKLSTRRASSAWLACNLRAGEDGRLDLFGAIDGDLGGGLASRGGQGLGCLVGRGGHVAKSRPGDGRRAAVDRPWNEDRS